MSNNLVQLLSMMEVLEFSNKEERVFLQPLFHFIG